MKKIFKYITLCALCIPSLTYAQSVDFYELFINKSLSTFSVGGYSNSYSWDNSGLGNNKCRNYYSPNSTAIASDQTVLFCGGTTSKNATTVTNYFVGIYRGNSNQLPLSKLSFVGEHSWMVPASASAAFQIFNKNNQYVTEFRPEPNEDRKIMFAVTIITDKYIDTAVLTPPEGAQFNFNTFYDKGANIDLNAWKCKGEGTYTNGCFHREYF